MDLRAMKIAVYTGTFNPLHIGHLAIMEYLTQDRDFGMVYLVVSPQSPFKEFMKVETGVERYRNAVEAVERHPELKVRVDDIELGMPAPQYTVRTLDALKAREPENEFTLIMGADNLADIRKWKDYRRILCRYGVAVYPREGYDMKALRDGLMEECVEGGSGDSDGGVYRIMLLEDAPMVDISSTRIREGIAAGRDMSSYMM